MSLSKQLYFGLTFVLTLVFFSSLWINVDNTRNYINSQLASHAQDTATSLGLSIKPFIGSSDDLPMVDGMISAIFDSGYYQKMTLKSNEGKVLLEKHNPMVFDDVPAWFVRLFPLTPPQASTEIHDGWVKPKTLHIVSHPGFGYEQLWQSAVKSSWMILGLFLLAGTLVSLILKTITDPIKKAAQQADEICQGNFIQVSDIPKPIELNLFVNAMNRMSRILQNLFNELTQQTEKYQRVAYVDELTSLSNRRAFNNQFESILANQEQGISGFLMIIRLSSLDHINKESGYTAGDEYVKSAVAIINSVLKYANALSNNNAYRLAGGDFAIILPDLDKESCHHIASELMTRFNQAAYQSASETDNHGQLNSFAHLGITDFSTADTLTDILIQADNALVEALSAKQGWQFASNIALQQGNSLWKSELEQQLVNGQVAFVAQAIKNPEGLVLYQELYARFTHTSEETLIPMGQLMAIAQRLNLAQRFDELVISQALLKAKQLQLPIAINLSPSSLGQQKFSEWLLGKLITEKDLCQILTFEISEQSLIQYANNVCSLSQQLKALGCKITLEHFGASTSSFTHLMKIKPEFVKIDGSYSQDIVNSQENQLFVQSLVNIAHSLHIKVIAELVENNEQQIQLSSLFVDYFQGYFIDQPSEW